jgi:hypothetical protein
MQLSETLVGQQGKCPACGQIIIVQRSGEIPPLGTPPLPSDSTAQPEISTTDAALAPTNTVGGTAKKLFDQVTESLKPWDSTSQGNNRYPHLSKYLAISEMLIKIAFIVGLIILILAVVLSILTGVRLLFRGPIQGIMVIVVSVIGGALYFLFLWLWRMMALAMTEFLRVIMDIELNTRNG